MTEPAPRPDKAGASSYDGDFYAWTQEQARHLRELAATLRSRRDPLGRRIDFENIAEEVESLGKSDRRALEGRLNVLLVYLLKWAYQPEQRSTSWRRSIVEQRRRILRILADSPSLSSYPEEVVPEEYCLARLAADETGLAEDAFPAVCPFTVEQILDPDWLPPAAGAA
ncbi:MAG: DUF29 domain-containing protein [Pseudomonadota bacterium]|nr:DUF29 domain-containing protein [Pseudomonadota bacterium]